jgi:catechol 2,3-dioxygenase-like lactoylglutathione lyase family enzyme
VQLRLRHLALAVADQERSRRFYEEHFGLHVSRRHDDGVLMLSDDYGFALAIGPADGSPVLPAFLHFGFAVAAPSEVGRCREQLASAGVQELEFVQEPEYVSVKVADPDGYVVEVYWEPTP